VKGLRGFLRDNGLSLVFGALFLGVLVFQAIAGHNEFNDEQRQHDAEQVSLSRYVTSARFASAVLENWQSEYLQFTLFILLTVWFLQRGSPESKEMGKAGGESDEEQRLGEHADPDSPRWARAGGLRTAIYSNSLVIVMGLIWVGCWFAQAVSGWTDYNDGRLDRLRQVPDHRGVLGALAPELAVGAAGRGLDGDLLGLPPPARIAGVEARGRAAPRDRRGGLRPNRSARPGRVRARGARRPRPARCSARRGPRAAPPR
jgi:hypothetical protein